MIITCKNCNEKLPPIYSKCPKCGAPIDYSYKKKPRNWYRLVILSLTVFVILGGILLLYERQDSLTLFLRSHDFDLFRVEDKKNALNDAMIGTIYNEVKLGQWEEGSIVEYEAYDENNNLIRIYRDEGTGRTIGFVVLAPIAKKVILSESDAYKIALELASKVPFIDFSSLILIQKELIQDPVVLNNPDAGNYYSFIWKTLDPISRAELFQTIKIDVNAETGQIVFFSSHDLGKVTISTTPQVNESSAKNIVMNATKNQTDKVDIYSTRLFVHKITDNQQQLLWEIVVKSLDSSLEEKVAWVYIDALTGETIDVKY